MPERPIVGLLALQGDYARHAEALGRHGLATREVRREPDFAGLAGLVLPGGESTTMLRLLERDALFAPLVAFCRSGAPVLATCAGLILLAHEVRDPAQPSLDLLDVTVSRNAYGRQVHSGVYPIAGPDLPPGTTGCFIRAPKILRTGPGVTVLARRGEDPVLVEQGNLLAACFHPELEPEHPVVARFAAQVEAAARCAR
jgi:5'-phosphate synthase pdxT subunit